MDEEVLVVYSSSDEEADYVVDLTKSSDSKCESESDFEICESKIPKYSLSLSLSLSPLSLSGVCVCVCVCVFYSYSVLFVLEGAEARQVKLKRPLIDSLRKQFSGIVVGL